MSDWRDWEPGRTGLSVAQLRDGETLRAQIVAEPYREATSESDDALHVPVVPLEFPDHVMDMGGDSLEEGEEYNIINSSTAFYTALTNAFAEGVNPDGQVVEITAHQPEDSYSRTYEIEP